MSVISQASNFTPRAFSAETSGAYSVYNWELFFHMPLLIAETLSRTLAKLKRRGIVRVHRHRVTILDPAKLQALAAGMKL